MTVESPHTVVIAGGAALFRGALARIVNETGDMRVVASTNDRIAVEAAVDRLHPAVAIIDAELGDEDGLHACAAIKAFAQGTKVLLTSETEDSNLLLRGVELGVDGYVTRAGTLSDILEAARSVAVGRAWVPPSMLKVLLRRLIDRGREDEVVQERFSRLSRRERDVLLLVHRGLDRDAIARQLIISPETARTHVQRVLTKLAVHSQLEAAALIERHGLAPRLNGSLLEDQVVRQ
jgi:DNA-binding NarL/FixJ family response regulator